jgi:hypothetical protein
MLYPVELCGRASPQPSLAPQRASAPRRRARAKSGRPAGTPPMIALRSGRSRGVTSRHGVTSLRKGAYPSPIFGLWLPSAGFSRVPVARQQRAVARSSGGTPQHLSLPPSRRPQRDQRPSRGTRGKIAQRHVQQPQAQRGPAEVPRSSGTLDRSSRRSSLACNCVNLVRSLWLASCAADTGWRRVGPNRGRLTPWPA